MNEPAISVCIPTYNAAPWIAATIDSVLAQTRRDFELVILDDCSADDTLSIVRRYDDPRIRLLVHEQNMGAEAAWNRLLQEARGRFVKLLCCDDLIYPTCLELQAAILESPSHASVAQAAAFSASSMRRAALAPNHAAWSSRPRRREACVVICVVPACSPRGSSASAGERLDRVHAAKKAADRAPHAGGRTGPAPQ